MRKLLIFINVLLVILSISCNNANSNLDFGEIYENNYVNQWIDLQFKNGNGWESIPYELLNKMSFPNEHVNLIGIESKEDKECINGFGGERVFLKSNDVFYSRPYALNYNDEASVVIEIFKSKYGSNTLNSVEDFLDIIRSKFKNSSYVVSFKFLETSKGSLQGVEFDKVSAEIDYGFPENLYAEYYIKKIDDFFVLIMMNYYNETKDVIKDFFDENVEVINKD